MTFQRCRGKLEPSIDTEPFPVFSLCVPFISCQHFIRYLYECTWQLLKVISTGRLSSFQTNKPVWAGTEWEHNARCSLAEAGEILVLVPGSSCVPSLRATLARTHLLTALGASAWRSTERWHFGVLYRGHWLLVCLQVWFWQRQWTSWGHCDRLQQWLLTRCPPWHLWQKCNGCHCLTHWY